mgnify:FL=1
MVLADLKGVSPYTCKSMRLVIEYMPISTQPHASKYKHASAISLVWENPFPEMQGAYPYRRICR